MSISSRSAMMSTGSLEPRMLAGWNFHASSRSMARCTIPRVFTYTTSADTVPFFSSWMTMVVSGGKGLWSRLRWDSPSARPPMRAFTIGTFPGIAGAFSDPFWFAFLSVIRLLSLVVLDVQAPALSAGGAVARLERLTM